MEKRESNIDSYTYSVELKLNNSPVLGYVSLWNGSSRVADFRVIKAGETQEAVRIQDEVIMGDISNINRDALIDILRNEKPLRLIYWVVEDEVHTMRVATNDEPVGEGE